MAEGMLRHQLDRAGIHAEVVSAGTWADEGAAATEQGVEAMRSMGIDISGHRARRLNPAEVEEADLVIAMTSVHMREIEALAPGSAGKVVLAKELAQLGEARLEAGAAPGASFHPGPRPAWRREMDLDDPMGLPPFAYERAARELAAGVAAVARMLGAPPP